MKDIAKDNPNYSFSKNKYFKKEIINGLEWIVVGKVFSQII